MKRSLPLVLAGFLVFGAPAANGDGAPALAFANGAGSITTPGGVTRYTARAQRHTTTLKAVTGRSVRTVQLSGDFVIPVVAFDGSPGGLSANGRTLVLFHPVVRYPPRSTQLAIVDTGPLKVRSYVTFHGYFAVDAVSPNGTWLYLIQYTSPGDPTKYRVRALNIDTLRMLRRDIIDPHDKGEQMRGVPITRISSPDGRWAYTLYTGSNEPFVHALDTAGLTARCIDLPGLTFGSGQITAHLTLTSNRLFVSVPGRLPYAVDLRTMNAQTTAAPTKPAPSPRKASARIRPSHGSLGMAGVIVAAFLILGVATLAVRSRRRRVPVLSRLDA
jgi:hypothetical protein